MMSRSVICPRYFAQDKGQMPREKVVCSADGSDAKCKGSMPLEQSDAQAVGTVPTRSI